MFYRAFAVLINSYTDGQYLCSSGGEAGSGLYIRFIGGRIEVGCSVDEELWVLFMPRLPELVWARCVSQFWFDQHMALDEVARRNSLKILCLFAD